MKCLNGCGRQDKCANSMHKLEGSGGHAPPEFSIFRPSESVYGAYFRAKFKRMHRRKLTYPRTSGNRWNTLVHAHTG